MHGGRRHAWWVLVSQGTRLLPACLQLVRLALHASQLADGNTSEGHASCAVQSIGA